MGISTTSLGPTGDVTSVAADAFCVSGGSGQLRRSSEQGLFVGDVRVLDHLVVRLDGREPLVLGGHNVGGDRARFTGAHHPSGDEEPDPRVLVDRRRVLSTSLWERVTLRNFGAGPVTVEVTLEADADFATIFDVKHARPTRHARCEVSGRGLRFVRDGRRTEVTVDPSPDDVDERAGCLHWRVEIPGQAGWSLTARVGVADHESHAESGAGGAAERWPERAWEDAADTAPIAMTPHLDAPALDCDDPRLPALVSQSVADLALLLVDDDGDRHFAAGAPWYLTLFGRDAIWAAGMALAAGLDVPTGTIRALARRQGRRHDPVTEEAPGKILHEVRRGGLQRSGDLPPTYFGSIDATPLFVCLVEEAWRWGWPDDEVARLLPPVRAALEWMRDDGDADGDGLLEHAAGGLVNQGWKDSVDGVQFADGALAKGPIALSEVQGYAHAAARRGGRLLEHFDAGSGEEWRAWADRLRDRFREAYWVADAHGPYPAIALDGDKRPVDSVASNMGHLLGTGLLEAEECVVVARRLVDPALHSGWGLRTLWSRSPRFNPLSYHGGSVWPHDTAIAVAGLAAEGHHQEAGRLLRSLLDVAPWFDHRLPELFAGERRREGFAPLPYPAACRPQAWSAAAGLLLLRTALGVHPDLPRGRILVRPLSPPPFERLEVRGLRIGAGRMDLTVDARRGVTVHAAPAGVQVLVED